MCGPSGDDRIENLLNNEKDLQIRLSDNVHEALGQIILIVICYFHVRVQHRMLAYTIKLFIVRLLFSHRQSNHKHN